MSVSNKIDLALSIPGLPVLNPMVDDFADRVLELAAIPEPRRQKLHEALISAVVLVEHALEQDGDLAMQLEISATIVPDSLEFRVLEHGKPLGDDIEEDTTGSEIRKRIRPANVFDQVYWLQKGQEGSELHLVAHREVAAIELIETYRHHLEEEQHDAMAHSDVQNSDVTGDYQVRGYISDDGLTIARRVYEAYGRSYPNPDLYIPERIERLNKEGRLHSIVCTSPTGEIVGHFALERPDLGPIGESGQAVIDHRHRGHGLMAPMRAAVEAAGAELGLLGIWSQPTARHPISQRMNLKFGSTPCALCLGTTPAEATLRGSNKEPAEDREASKRHSCFLYWHPLTEEPPIVAYVPESLAAVVTSLYAARKREALIVTERVRLPEGHSMVHTRFDAARGVSWIAIDNITNASYDSIHAAIEAMKVSARAATIFIDLPIDDSGAVLLATELMGDGIRFAGIGPRFRKLKDIRRAEDVLRLQLNIAPVDLNGLVVEGELGKLLADAVLGKDRAL